MPALRALRVAQSPPRIEMEGNWMPLGQAAVLQRSDIPNGLNTKSEIEGYVNSTWLPSVMDGRGRAVLTIIVINGPNDIVWKLEVFS